MFDFIQYALVAKAKH